MWTRVRRMDTHFLAPLLRGALKPDARGLTERGDLAALQTLLDAPEP